MSSFLAEVLLGIFGDLLGGLLPVRHATEPPAEGEWNASSGSLAAFLALLGALFSGMAITVMYRGPDDAVLALVCALGPSSAVAATILARHSLRVTKRRRALAWGALWTSRATLAVLAVMALGVVLRRF